MMLYIKEAQYSWGDIFFVMGEDNAKKYRVKSSVLLWNKKLEVFDIDKNPLFTIQAEPRSLLKKKFYIRTEDNRKVTVTKELSLIPKYTIEGLDWQMKGVMLHEYEMQQGGQTVLHFCEGSPYYELHLYNTADELMALAMVLTITYAMNMSSDGSSGLKM